MGETGSVDAHHDSIFLTNSVGSLVTVCCHNNREDVKLTATFGTTVSENVGDSPGSDMCVVDPTDELPVALERLLHHRFV